MDAITEADIWRRVILPEQGQMTPELARHVLRLDFAESDHDRMADLSRKANDGTLSTAERRELETYVNVGHALALLQAQARLSLRGRSSAA